MKIPREKAKQQHDRNVKEPDYKTGAKVFIKEMECKQGISPEHLKKDDLTIL